MDHGSDNDFSGHSLADVMNTDVLEGFSSYKAYQQLHQTMVDKVAGSNDDNIADDCADKIFE